MPKQHTQWNRNATKSVGKLNNNEINTLFLAAIFQQMLIVDSGRLRSDSSPKHRKNNTFAMTRISYFTFPITQWIADGFSSRFLSHVHSFNFNFEYDIRVGFVLELIPLMLYSNVCTIFSFSILSTTPLSRQNSKQYSCIMQCAVHMKGPHK